MAAVEDFVWYYGGNGAGSTKTKNRKFSTLHDSAGTSITANSSGDQNTNGLILTVGEAGLYSVVAVDFSAAAASRFGISLNDTSGTTAIESLAGANRLGMTHTDGAGTGFDEMVCWVGWLNASDYVSLCSECNGADDTVMFYMARINFS